jgi:pimeloyl-ACP methyl ester carboxylesterase
MPGAGGAANAGGKGGAGTGAGGMTPAGPEDGDTAKPIVAIPNVPCRNPSAAGFGLGKPNLKVDDRDVIVDYPCDKHEGAPITVILNLHGTTPDAQRFYQWGYFSAYKHVSSHNLVVLTPKSVVDQWGNGDNGADEPYLLHVIDWAYTNFAAFNIRGMWVGGHSWGSLYASRFGCNDKIADKVKGIILMSGASRPACAARVAIINSAANLKPDPADSSKTIVSPEALLDQNAVAMMHGCDASQMMAVDANNDETFWPNCDPGFAHANYLMKTKQHATFMDASVVKSIVDWIKLARQ